MAEPRLLVKARKGERVAGARYTDRTWDARAGRWRYKYGHPAMHTPPHPHTPEPSRVRAPDPPEPAADRLPAAGDGPIGVELENAIVGAIAPRRYDVRAVTREFRTVQAEVRTLEDEHMDEFVGLPVEDVVRLWDSHPCIYFNPAGPVKARGDNEVGRGRFLFTKRPIPLEDMARRGLLVSDQNRADLEGAVMLAYYRRKHPGEPIVLTDPTRGDGNHGAVIAESVHHPGKWQLTRYDSDGFSGDELSDDLIGLVGRALMDRYWLPDLDHFERTAATERFGDGVKLSMQVQRDNAARARGEWV